MVVFLKETSLLSMFQCYFWQILTKIFVEVPFPIVQIRKGQALQNADASCTEMALPKREIPSFPSVSLSFRTVMVTRFPRGKV